MIFIKILAIILISLTPQALAQKVPAKGVNQATNMGICRFLQKDGQTQVTVEFNKTLRSCVRCKIITTLLLREDWKRLGGDKKIICGNECNGVYCYKGDDNYECQTPTIVQQAEETCLNFGRAAVGTGIGGTKGSSGNTVQSNGSQIPLIIGFTVGGILLAIVVAGILLGRNQKSDEGDGSEVMTTPVSLSNSEWHSNGNSSSARRNRENMRVEEASTEDLTAVPLHEITGSKKEYQQDENANDYVLKAADSGSSEQESYSGSDNVTYYPRYSPLCSNRSSEVILEDGYVPGGNFVGSSDLHLKSVVQKNGHATTNGIVDSNNQTLVQNFFNGHTPGRMTHEDLTMSLTPSTAFGEIEYEIEDENMTFAIPQSHTSLNGTSSEYEMQLLGETRDEMQISFHCRDTDSDFDDSSRPTSGVKSDKSDVFFTPNKESQVFEKKYIESVQISRIDSPCSESGIEVSCNSKDSCEIKNINTQGCEEQFHPQSWNENCKGRSSKHVSTDGADMQNNRTFANRDTRSKSCIWKSPAAPTHSASRARPGHCPTSAPAYSRPNPTNLTHVFVDVHRNMASSDEDLLSHNNGRSHKRHSATDSETSSLSDIVISDSQHTPDHEPFDSRNRHLDPATKLARQKRNKSLYLMRDGGAKRTQQWTPRTVRFSSSGSGEYAIPFGSLVP